jgi:hypothetical protein
MNHIPDTGKMVETHRTDAEAVDFRGDGYMVPNPKNGDYVSVEFARQLERELQETHGRIRLLIAERDSARQQADLNWKLRDEFAALLGTDDVEEAVRELKRLKARRISTTQTK